MNNIIATRKYPAELVLWTRNQETNEPIGITEASTLGFGPGEIPAEQIWNDACDIGLIFYNSKKDTHAIFILNERQSDNSRWVFTSYKLPREVKLIVFND